MKYLTLVVPVALLVFFYSAEAWLLPSKSVSLLSDSSVREGVRPPPVVGCPYTEQGTLAYALRTEVSMPEPGLGAPADVFSAALSVRVLDVNDTRTRLRAGLSDVELRQELSEPEDRVNHSIEAAFEMDVSPNCQILALRFPSTWSDAARVLVASSIQLHAYVVDPGPVWEAEQVDGIGPHRARYRRRGTRLERHKLFYRTEETETFGMKIEVPLSDAVAGFGPRGLQASTVRERLIITLRGQVSVNLEQHSTLHLDDALFLEPRPADSLATFDPDAPDDSESVDWPLVPTDAASARAVYTDLSGRLAKWTVRDARTMAALLRAHPELATSLVARLEEPNLDGGERASVFWALELAGTPTAKHHLTALLEAERAHDRIRAAAALAAAGTPSLEDGAALLELRHRQDENRIVASSALLALGFLGREAPPEVKTFVKAQLWTELTEATSAEATRAALGAIGNMAESDFLEAASGYLSSEDPSIRVAAASALRGMGRRAAAPLRSALETESLAKTARAMAETLVALGPPSDLDIVWVQAQLAEDASNPIRAQLIDWLGSAKTPEAQAVLVAHFRQETSSRVRQQIGRFVPVSELGR